MCTEPQTGSTRCAASEETQRRECSRPTLALAVLKRRAVAISGDWREHAGRCRRLEGSDQATSRGALRCPLAGWPSPARESRQPRPKCWKRAPTAPDALSGRRAHCGSLAIASIDGTSARARCKPFDLHRVLARPVAAARASTARTAHSTTQRSTKTGSLPAIVRVRLYIHVSTAAKATTPINSGRDPPKPENSANGSSEPVPATNPANTTP